MSDQGLFNLEGRSALVTGGGQGLGRAMAVGLARHGANIAILEINPETGQDAAHEMERLGIKSLALSGDVTKEDSAERAVRAVVDAWGRLDILVNNAGFALLSAAEETGVAEFKSVYELDVFGMFICSKAAFAPMSRQKQGNIINISSMCGLTVLVPQKHASYNSAKAAVIMLTKSLAVEWASHGIRVNAIAPGYMCTPPVQKLQQENPERWAFWMSKVPLGRAGDPAELEGVVVFLASRASSYMTGSVLVIDGGHTCM
jgi:NAD(P)-dependent dehydrogenase (short-subunit alcohol dehydrogenase family)